VFFCEGVMTELPVIDVSGLTSAEFSDRRSAASKLGHACRETGFFYVVNHGIPDAAREAIFAAARAFFSLPLAAKEACSIKRSRHNRGYVALEGERLNESAVQSDYKEAFNVGLELAADHPEVLAGKPFRGGNLWPAISGWRETILGYYDACSNLGRRIHRGFALISASRRISSKTSSMLRWRSCGCCTIRNRSGAIKLPKAGPACTPIMAT
jgi:isopenicillin N synthase-like dioxygenase